MTITDDMLSASIAADAFHTAELAGHDMDSFEAVGDLLAQVFPSAEAEPSGVWSLRMPGAGATFKPGKRGPASVR